MSDSSQLPADTARQFAEFIQSPEASAILKKALDQAIAESGMVERLAAHTDEAAATIQQLSARSGDSGDEVLRKALMLYELALDAIEKGNYVAILTPEDEIVREIIGFEPAGTTSQTVGR